MMNRMLITFNRNNIERNADLGEHIGNIGLGLLRIGFGKTVTVEKSLQSPDLLFDFKKKHAIKVRVAAVALFILVLPLTMLLSGIGCIGTAFSKSHEEVFNCYQSNIQKTENKANDLGEQIRKQPPIAICDTVCGNVADIRSAHNSHSNKIEFFKDEEILKKLKLIKRKQCSKAIVQGDVGYSSNLEKPIYAYYTENNKAIIQQQATRGCTAAVTAMLIMDNNKAIDYTALRGRNLGNEQMMIQDIKNAQLNCVQNDAEDIKKLKELIIENNSAIVDVNGDDIGGHVIIVDEVSENCDTVRLRDPYHGWEITVTATAFTKCWKPGTVIQIKTFPVENGSNTN